MLLVVLFTHKRTGQNVLCLVLLKIIRIYLDVPVYS